VIGTKPRRGGDEGILVADIVNQHYYVDIRRRQWGLLSLFEASCRDRGRDRGKRGKGRVGEKDSRLGHGPFDAAFLESHVEYALSKFVLLALC